MLKECGNLQEVGIYGFLEIKDTSPVMYSNGLSSKKCPVVPNFWNFGCGRYSDGLDFVDVSFFIDLLTSHSGKVADTMTLPLLCIIFNSQAKFHGHGMI